MQTLGKCSVDVASLWNKWEVACRDGAGLQHKESEGDTATPEQSTQPRTDKAAAAPTPASEDAKKQVSHPETPAEPAAAPTPASEDAKKQVSHPEPSQPKPEHQP